MAVSVKVQIDEKTFREADRLLGQMVQAVRRGEFIQRGLAEAGEVVRKKCYSLLPAPGYPGDKPGLKPLRDTLKTKVKAYEASGAFVAVVGPDWNGGQHGHLVEEGHELVAFGAPTSRRVEGKHYLRIAAETTKAEQNQAFLNAIRLGLTA